MSFSYSTKQKLRHIVWTILFFIIGIYLYSMARFWGPDLTQGEFLQDLFVAVIGGAIGGALLGFFHEYLIGDQQNRKPFGWLILTETLVDIAIIIAVFVPVTALGGALFTTQTLGEAFSYNLSYMFTLSFLSLLIYLLALSTLFNFLRQISKKVGTGVMWGLISGKYHQPREESHIIMFLDLKSSTTHAERLGHLKYSRFLQDCFFDLNHLAIKHEAGIYKYVGDEAILSWPLEEGIRNANCIRMYFAFHQRLEERREYYLNTYGFVPVFKAGLNAGTITVAEVGEYRREIEYHGDVLNTGARIQGQCNVFDKGILVSKDLVDLLAAPAQFVFEEMGNVELKGKEKTVHIYAVNESGNPPTGPA